MKSIFVVSILVVFGCIFNGVLSVNNNDISDSVIDVAEMVDSKQEIEIEEDVKNMVPIAVDDKNYFGGSSDANKCIENYCTVEIESCDKQEQCGMEYSRFSHFNKQFRKYVENSFLVSMKMHHVCSFNLVGGQNGQCSDEFNQFATCYDNACVTTRLHTDLKDNCQESFDTCFNDEFCGKLMGYAVAHYTFGAESDFMKDKCESGDLAGEGCDSEMFKTTLSCFTQHVAFPTNDEMSDSSNIPNNIANGIHEEEENVSGDFKYFTHSMSGMTWFIVACAFVLSVLLCVGMKYVCSMIDCVKYGFNSPDYKGINADSEHATYHSV